MKYLNKLLQTIKTNPEALSCENKISLFGLTSTEIQKLKKEALSRCFLEKVGQKYYLTELGEEFLIANPLNNLRADITVNTEYFKEEKTPSVLSKAIRQIAKHLFYNEVLKPFSLEEAILKDVSTNKKLLQEIETRLFKNKESLADFFAYFQNQNITKSLTSVFLLLILAENKSKIIVYEKEIFQLNIDPLMFDRMIACPQNFKILEAEMLDVPILKDVSKIILNENNNNILDITKGLIKTMKSLDKYTINTQNLTQKSLRLKNIILNAKDPMSLFERDIPKALSGKILKDCDRNFIQDLKTSLEELKSATTKLVENLELFIYKSFKTNTRQDLTDRFLKIKEYIGESELKILFNNITTQDVSDELWVKRIATFVNKSRVPKDWNDDDIADFKLKVKDLAFRFFIIESTLGSTNCCDEKKLTPLLNKFNKLDEIEKKVILRKFAELSFA